MSNKISIIVPAYNIEKYIARCIDSILDQTYKNIEIIIVNDGSNDTTPNILEKYARKYDNIIVINKKNGGVSQARIDGINKASGEWIGFVDGDDEIETNMFEILLNNALKYNADISHCGHQMIFPSGRIEKYYGTEQLLIQDNEKGIIDLLSGNLIEPGLWNKLYKKDLFKKAIISNFDTTIKNNEDLLLNYFLFKESKKSVFIDRCFYHYMIRKNSASTSKINQNKLCDPLKVLKLILKDVEKNEIGYNETLSRICALLIRRASMSPKIQRDLILPYREEVRKELRNNLFVFLRNEKISLKLKVMAIWVSISPNSYGLFHSMYSKITGSNKKYSIDI